MKSGWIQIFDGPDRPMRYESRKLPREMGDGDVLAEISLATICGSDLHTLSGRREEQAPCVLGHEGVGRIVAVGTGRNELAVEDRITWSIADSCGQCVFCTDYNLPEKCTSVFKYGHALLADGTGLNGYYATHIMLRPGTGTVKVPDTIPDSIAATANCALATIINAVSRIPESAKAVLIQGAGMLGLFACAVLHNRGLRKLFCIDTNKKRLALVSSFGGIPIDARRSGYKQEQRKILNAAPVGVDAVLEVAGVAELVPEGIQLLRTGGHYGFVGMVHPHSHLDLTGEQIIRKCLTIQGTHNYSHCHLEASIRFLEKTIQSYPYGRLVSPPFPLIDLKDAIHEAESQKYCRVSVKPNID